MRSNEAPRVIATLTFIVAANLFAVAFVATERFVYAWDWAAYWNKFGMLGHMFRTDPTSAAWIVIESVRLDDYNLIPVLPLMPFEWLFGPGRLSYILAIINIALLPAAGLLALVANHAMPNRSNIHLFLSVAAILSMHALWAPALRGMPDVLGVAIASAILLVYFQRPVAERDWFALAWIGALLCLLILTRRWYLFWAFSFFPAAIAGHFADANGRPHWRSTLETMKALTIIGVSCAAFVLISAAPLVLNAFRRSYSSAYSGYRSELAGGLFTQVIGHFGGALLILCIGGLVWLAARPQTRGFGIFLIVQASLAFAMFTYVQSFLGVHHYYLLLPTMGIGAAAAIVGLWDVSKGPRWRMATVVTALFTILLSSFASLSPVAVAAPPMLPVERYPPLVRDDLRELDRLLAALTELKPQRVYVVAGSKLLNWSVLSMAACRGKYPQLCHKIAVTEDVDARDGFPAGLLLADYAVLGTPTQYDLLPKDQQVVGLLADAMREGRGIGASFQKVGQTFQLAQGIRADIYRRARPLEPAAVKALSDELLRRYPGQMQLFSPPTDRKP